MPTVCANDIELYYERVGNGPPRLWLNGSGSTIAHITCPTLVASGRYDGTAPPASGEAIAARISGAELHLYEGGQPCMVQDGAAVPEITDFLSAA